MEAIGILEENKIGAIWQICFIANSFIFPIYARFDREYDLSRMEFVVLYVTAHRANTMAWEICGITGLPKNNISRGVQKLQKKGLITRVADPCDARRSFLNLTEKGTELYEKLIALYADRADAILSLLDDEDRAALEIVTLKLSKRLAATKLS
ncbi:winged helix DNA-binding protein [Rhodospirillaceae bacterium KN72]|uniref:Winged helix DNA-binding protein n=1 Tax=Pacificispira spongiicola TaxID=2729598 RepID=A0A7Y0E121_9PROT|nr:MarR family transcriptional regulator [Pacificispira spongiicola]NMM45289.1 winged helix DNA-binding protein [Pacificispira spongiicola]